MKAYPIILGVVLVLIYSGCSPRPAEPQGTPSEPEAIPSEIHPALPTSETPAQEGETQLSPALPIPGVRGLEAAVEKAREDLAQRISIATSEIKVIESIAVTWPDASLGCPQPGTIYAQTTMPGFLIRLEANESEFEYHANIHSQVVLCENPEPPIATTSAP